MKTSLLFPGMALAIGLGVGFGIGKTGGSGDEPDLASIESEMRTRSKNRPALNGSREARNEKTQRNIDDIYRQPGQTSRVQSLLDLYSNLSAAEFSGEADKLEGLPFNERILASVLLFGKWAEVDPTAAMGYADTMGFVGMMVRPTVLQGWASTDPVNAAKYYSENPSQFAMMNMMGGGRGGIGPLGPAEIIAGEWAKQDPNAAMAWASGLKTNSAAAMSSVVSEVAKTDPMKAVGMVAEMGEDARGEAYRNIARVWGQKDFSEVSAWVAGLPDTQRGAAMSAAIEGLASANPVLAARELSKVSDLEARNRVIPSVAKHYARADVTGSMEWLNSLDDEAKSASMREVMPVWAASDPAATMSFIQSQTSAEVKDRAAESYIWSNRSAPPAQLVEVAAMIGDEGDRSRATSVLASRWMQEDKAAATEFINSTDAIPAETKERILSGRPVWGGGGRGRGRGGD
jgi:hypothetical protein